MEAAMYSSPFLSNLVAYTRTQLNKWKVKGLPQQAEVAQGVPARLSSRIFLTFSTTMVVGRHPYAPAAFTPRRNPWYSSL